MIGKYLGLVKFSHTIFAIPFALIGYTLGVLQASFSWWTLLGVVACMVLARSAAMGFNRLIDRKFDAANPRTASREIPAGLISVRAAKVFVAACSIGFVAVAATFNVLTFVLSPVALAVVLGYSYTKRFTPFCHLVLGLGLAIAPTAAYIAVTGEFSLISVIFSGLVLAWVSGFDIIFALQDVDFDRNAGLNSIPAQLGVKGGLVVSALLHIVCYGFTLVAGAILITRFGASPILMWCGVSVFGGLLLYQHIIVKPSDLSRVNLAFGTTNGIASVIYATFVILSLVL